MIRTTDFTNSTDERQNKSVPLQREIACFCEDFPDTLVLSEKTQPRVTPITRIKAAEPAMAVLNRQAKRQMIAQEQLPNQAKASAGDSQRDAGRGRCVLQKKKLMPSVAVTPFKPRFGL